MAPLDIVPITSFGNSNKRRPSNDKLENPLVKRRVVKPVKRPASVFIPTRISRPTTGQLRPAGMPPRIPSPESTPCTPMSPASCSPDMVSLCGEPPAKTIPSEPTVPSEPVPIIHEPSSQSAVSATTIREPGPMPAANHSLRNFTITTTTTVTTITINNFRSANSFGDAMNQHATALLNQCANHLVGPTQTNGVPNVTSTFKYDGCTRADENDNMGRVEEV